MSSASQINKDEVVEVQPTIFGTLEHWENTYTEELQTFEENGVLGDSWFGKGVENKLIEYISRNNMRFRKIADIGCGNGHLITELAKRGFNRLTALDYSEKAIDLTKKLVFKHELESSVSFMVLDMLEELDKLKTMEKKFDICIDKGTYDSISSMKINAGQKNPRMLYFRNVRNILQPSGIFMLISCNWTRAEILQHTKSVFELVETIETSKISFGGSEGGGVCIVVLKPIPEELQTFEKKGALGDDLWFGKNVENYLIEYISKSNMRFRKIADVGCGDGLLITELAKRGFNRLTALDCSQKAIDSTKKLVFKHELESSVRFMVIDVLHDVDKLKTLEKKFDVCIDKGTYDSICSMKIEADQKRPCPLYFRSIRNIMQPSGIFILISFKWTRAEIRHHTKSLFELVESLQTPKVAVGGSEDESVCMVVLKPVPGAEAN